MKPRELLFTQIFVSLYCNSCIPALFSAFCFQWRNLQVLPKRSWKLKLNVCCCFRLSCRKPYALHEKRDTWHKKLCFGWYWSFFAEHSRHQDEWAPTISGRVHEFNFSSIPTVSPNYLGSNSLGNGGDFQGSILQPGAGIFVLNLSSLSGSVLDEGTSRVRSNLGGIDFGMVRNQEELNNVRIFLGSSTSINNFMVYWGWGTQILRLRIFGLVIKMTPHCFRTDAWSTWMVCLCWASWFIEQSTVEID